MLMLLLLDESCYWQIYMSMDIKSIDLELHVVAIDIAYCCLKTRNLFH